jgi:hypothetical protein
MLVIGYVVRALSHKARCYSLGAFHMKFFDDILVRIGNDPVTYALRIVFLLGVLLVVFLLFFPSKAVAAAWEPFPAALLAV